MTCLITAEQAPTNLTARQTWINIVRVSWTIPPIHPAYLITKGDTRPTGSSAGIRVIFGYGSYSFHQVQQQPGTTKYWVVALYRTPIVVGPVSATVVRGEEMM